MTRVMWVRFTVFVSCVSAVLSIAMGAPAKESAGRIAGLVAAFYRTRSDFSADFVQVVQARRPRRRFVRRGHVYFKRPNFMRWDYVFPDQVYYVSDGKGLWCYEVEEGNVYQLDIGGSDLAWAIGFLSAVDRVEKDFHLSLDGEEDGHVKLKLVPKADQRLLKSLTLVVDRRTGQVRRTLLVDPVGNVSSVTFKNPSFESLPAEGFRFNPPPGVTVQDLSSKKK